VWITIRSHDVQEIVLRQSLRRFPRTLPAERWGVEEAVIEAEFAHAVRNGWRLDTGFSRTPFLDQRRSRQTWADYLDRLRLGAEVLELHVAG
jgi:hypothetical protein